MRLQQGLGAQVGLAAFTSAGARSELRRPTCQIVSHPERSEGYGNQLGITIASGRCEDCVFRMYLRVWRDPHRAARSFTYEYGRSGLQILPGSLAALGMTHKGSAIP